jgi:Mitochondrial domain of unknown function (DUF1713)
LSSQLAADDATEVITKTVIIAKIILNGLKMISLSKLRGNTHHTLINTVISYCSFVGTFVSTRLIAASLRNLSISSNSQPSSNHFAAGKLPSHELSLNPFILRQNTNLIKDVGISCPLWRKKEIFDLPLTNKVIDNPTKINKVIEDVVDEEKSVILPDNTKSDDDSGKQAKNHMILIRRIKMNKHKLKKLRKKMKYEWAKVSSKSGSS